MVKVRPPSRVGPVAFPVFGITWWASPFTGDSWIAYVGGGGSAKTGVNNQLVILSPFTGENVACISTGDQVGVGITMHQPSSKLPIEILVAIANEVRTYEFHPFEEEKLVLTNTRKLLEAHAGANAVAIYGPLTAVGTESGTVCIYHEDRLVFEGQGHEKAVCSLSFAARAPLLASGAKDGTARIWDTQSRECISILKCSAHDPDAKRQQSSILVRGVSFGDLEGHVLFTICSGRRGKAFLAAWEEHPPEPDTVGALYKCMVRTPISTCPISSMSMAGDGSYIAFGAVDGSIIIWNTEKWKAQKKFDEVHGLPVTTIAARPLPILKGEEEYGTAPMHAISASADGQMGFLSLSNKRPRKAKSVSSGSTGFMICSSLLGWVWLFIFIVSVIHFVLQFQYRCQGEETGDLGMPTCFMDHVLIASSSHPGIMYAPH